MSKLPWTRATPARYLDLWLGPLMDGKDLNPLTCSGPTTTASFSDNAPNPLRIRLGGPTSDAAYDDEGVNLIEVTTVGPCAVGTSCTGPTDY